MDGEGWHETEKKPFDPRRSTLVEVLRRRAQHQPGRGLHLLLDGEARERRSNYVRRAGPPGAGHSCPPAALEAAGRGLLLLIRLAACQYAAAFSAAFRRVGGSCRL